MTNDRVEVIVLTEKLKWCNTEQKIIQKHYDKMFEYFNDKYPDEMETFLGVKVT